MRDVVKIATSAYSCGLIDGATKYADHTNPEMMAALAALRDSNESCKAVDSLLKLDRTCPECREIKP